MFRLSWKIVTLYGIPIRLHVSLPVLLLFFILNTGSFWLGTVLFLLLFFSVLLHEAGHTLRVLARGGRVRSVELWCLGGAAVVDRPPRTLNDEFTSALAGPLVSLCLAVFFALLRLPLAAAEGSTVSRLLGWGVTLNLMLFGFNLLPAFPMDGGRVLRAFLARFIGFLPATVVAARLGKGISLILGLVGLFSGRVFLMLIAVMIYLAAEQELTTVRMGGLRETDAWPRDADGERAETPPQIKISPPPYERGPKKKERFRDFFRKWFP